MVSGASDRPSVRVGAQRLAPWVGALPLGAHVTVDVTLLELRLIQWRFPGAFDDLDVDLLCETHDPEEAKRLSAEHAARYQRSPSWEGRRVGDLCAKLAETIGRHSAPTAPHK